MNRISHKLVGLGALLALTAGSASAGVVWSGSSGSRAASVDFSVSGSSLLVTLTNTGAGDALVPTDILTGVYFDITGSALSLSRTSAVLAAGSVMISGTTDAGGVVGGEWAYKGGLSGAPYSAKYGISASGLGLFGGGDRFPGTNLAGPTAPAGLDYGITSAGDNGATGNGGLLGTPLIKNSVVFTLGGIGQNFNLADIGNVSFQYGTDLSEPNVQASPTPGALALLGMAGLGARSRRRK